MTAIVAVATGSSTVAWGAKRLALTASPGGKGAAVVVRTQLFRVLKAHKITAVAGKGDVPADDEAWVALGKKLKVDGFVDLKFDLRRGGQSVEVSVRTAADGSALGSETFTAKGLARNLGVEVAHGFWKKMGGHVQKVRAAKGGEVSGIPPRDLSHEPQAAPIPEKSTNSLLEKESATKEKPGPSENHGANEKPAAGEPAVAATDRETPVQIAKPPERQAGPASVVVARPTPPNSDKGAGRDPAAAVVLAARYMHRSFLYTPRAAAPANSSSSPTVGADLTWFPLAHFGLLLGAEYASGQKILQRYPSVILDLRASLSARLPLSFGYVYAHAGGFRSAFTIADDGTGMRAYLALPDAVYLGARAGAGIHARFLRAFSIDGEASYRRVTDMAGGTYPITSPGYFARAVSGPAFDAAVSVSYRLTRALALQVGGDFRRYAISARGMSGDRIAASDATDQYLAAWLGVVGLLGGR